jgi:hypothetical protein
MGTFQLRVRPMRGLKSFECATRLFPALDVLHLVEREFARVAPVGTPCTGGHGESWACRIASAITRLGPTL